MRPLSAWLELMLAEIGQRQEQASAAAEEAQRRAQEGAVPTERRVPAHTAARQRRARE